jgi:hypothetical protein
MINSCETTVLVEFVRSDSGLDDRARVTRRSADVARMDAAPVDELAGVPAGDLRWLVKLVPALLVSMAPGR